MFYLTSRPERRPLYPFNVLVGAEPAWSLYAPPETRTNYAVVVVVVVVDLQSTVFLCHEGAATALRITRGGIGLEKYWLVSRNGLGRCRSPHRRRSK